MAKKRKQGGKGGFAADIRSWAADLLDDETVQRFELSVDKRAGLARLRCTAADGRVTTRELLDARTGEAALPDPADKPARDAAIRRLTAQGLTQTATARLLGVSQALVSKVLRGD